MTERLLHCLHFVRILACEGNVMDGTYVSFQTSQWDGIRKWEPSWMGFVPLLESQETWLPVSAVRHERIQWEILNLEEGSHQNPIMLASGSQTSSLQTVRNKLLLFKGYPLCCTLLQQPKQTKTLSWNQKFIRLALAQFRIYWLILAREPAIILSRRFTAFKSCINIPPF